MKGTRTYTGILVSLLGFIGVAQYFNDTELTQVVDNIIQLVGLAVAVYGRYKANK